MFNYWEHSETGLRSRVFLQIKLHHTVSMSQSSDPCLRRQMKLDRRYYVGFRFAWKNKYSYNSDGIWFDGKLSSFLSIYNIIITSYREMEQL